MKISKGTIIRTALLVLAIVNNVLALFGKAPLPITNEQLELIISTIFTVVMAVINWWKNNSFTKEAIEADEYLARLKGGDAE